MLETPRARPLAASRGGCALRLRLTCEIVVWFLIRTGHLVAAPSTTIPATPWEQGFPASAVGACVPAPGPFLRLMQIGENVVKPKDAAPGTSHKLKSRPTTRPASGQDRLFVRR